eukprot:3222754-Amphidinium_carterae.1
MSYLLNSNVQVPQDALNGSSQSLEEYRRILCDSAQHTNSLIPPFCLIALVSLLTYTVHKHPAHLVAHLRKMVETATTFPLV